MAVPEQVYYDNQFDLVSWVLGNQAYDQHQTIYIDPDHPKRSVTGSEARTTIKKLIAGFRAAGLKKGNCVCIHGYNDVTYPLIFLAIIGAGGIFTGCNPSYTATELIRHLKTTDAKFLLIDSDLLTKLSDDLRESGVPAKSIFQLNNQGHEVSEGFQSYQDLLTHGEARWETFSKPEQAKTTTAALLSTSGTSGLPKAAKQSHYSFIMQTKMLDDNAEKPYEVSRLVALPIFHAFAFPLAHLLPLLQGTPTYIMRRFDLFRFLEHIRDYEITETAIVPTIVASILKSPIKAHKHLRPLRTVWCAGSTLPQLTQNDFFRILRPTARLLQTWGMTEAGWVTTFLWPEKDHSGSCGRLLPGFEAKLMYNGQVVTEDNVQAEIYIRGPSIMQGYLNNPEATAAAIDKGGWLRTGDVAYKEQGKFYIVDREKELIKVRGWQISPAELEAQLLLHPAIKDAAVIGIVSADGDTEFPRAYIVKAEGHRVSEPEIKQYMSKNLAKFKSLDGGVRFIDTIPKNSTGKIVRNALRKVAAAEKAAQQELTIKVIPASKNGSMTPPPLSGDSIPSAAASETDTRPTTPVTEPSSGSDADDEEDVKAKGMESTPTQKVTAKDASLSNKEASGKARKPMMDLDGVSVARLNIR